jgi:hypothetical protein
MRYQASSNQGQASAQAVDAIGMFLRERLKVGVRDPL